MNKDQFFHITAAIIFSVIGILHLARISGEWQAFIYGQPVPMWLSWAAAVIAGYLAVRGFEIYDRCRDK